MLGWAQRILKLIKPSCDGVRQHAMLGLQSEHFPHWLDVWELNNGRHLASHVAEEMNGRAHELGRRLFSLTRSRRPLGAPQTPDRGGHQSN